MFYAQTILPVKQLMWSGSFTNQSNYVLNFMFIFYLCFQFFKKNLGPSTEQSEAILLQILSRA